MVFLDFAFASDALEGFLGGMTLPRGFRLRESALAGLILCLLACHKVLFHDLLQVDCLCSGEGGARLGRGGGLVREDMREELVASLGLLEVEVGHLRSEEHLVRFKSQLETLADLTQDQVGLRAFLLDREGGGTLVMRVQLQGDDVQVNQGSTVIVLCDSRYI